MLLVILSFYTVSHKLSYFFRDKNNKECAIFYSLSTYRLKTEASFNEKISFMRSGEKVLKSLNNFIVRRCGMF